MAEKWPEIVVKRPFNTLLRFPKKGGGYYKTEIVATLILESLWSEVINCHVIPNKCVRGKTQGDPKTYLYLLYYVFDNCKTVKLFTYIHYRPLIMSQKITPR